MKAAAQGKQKGVEDAWEDDIFRRAQYVSELALQDYRMLLGVIRPGPVEGGANTEDVDGHCFYRAATGSRFPGTIGWEGSSPRNSRATASACCSTSTRAA